MKTISEHEFIERGGVLGLLVHTISFDEQSEPVLLVSKFEDKAYLRRSPGDVYEITDISPTVIDQVRGSQNIVVMELLGDKATHSYNAITALLEDDEHINVSEDAV